MFLKNAKTQSNIKFFILLGFLLWSCGLQAQTKIEYSLRAMTYNLHHCEGLDKKLDINRIAGVISEQHPDVVAVQEMDSVTIRTGRVYQLGELASKLKMFAVYGPSMPYQGGKYGIGILSKEQPICVRRIPLPGKEEPRLLLICEFKNYVFACTHLSLTEESLLESLPIILSEARKETKPFIIAGDWNTTPNSKFIKEFTNYFQLDNNVNIPTIPSNNPKEHIDYIASFKTAKVKKVSDSVIAESVASDHRPCVADLKFSRY